MPLLVLSAATTPKPSVVFRASVLGDVLTITRQDLKEGRAKDAPRQIARILGIQGLGDGNTISPRPLVSPDGLRLAVRTGFGSRTVPGEPVTLAGQRFTTTQEVGGQELVFVLDTDSGRVLSRSAFDRVASYDWSGSSRALGVLALSRDYKRSSVSVVREGHPSRLVRHDATTLFWTGDALLTATWSKNGRSVPYGEIVQVYGSRWTGYRPSIHRHVGGRETSLGVGAAERELGTFGLGAKIWSPSPDVAGRPLKNPRERSVLVEAYSDSMRVQPQYDADGREIIAMSSGPTESVDLIFSRGRRYRVVHHGYKFGDGGTGRRKSWNLGGGSVAFLTDDLGLWAMDLRTRRKRYWSVDPGRYADYDILWR